MILPVRVDGYLFEHIPSGGPDLRKFPCLGNNILLDVLDLDEWREIGEKEKILKRERSQPLSFRIPN